MNNTDKALASALALLCASAIVWLAIKSINTAPSTGACEALGGIAVQEQWSGDTICIESSAVIK